MIIGVIPRLLKPMCFKKLFESSRENRTFFYVSRSSNWKHLVVHLQKIGKKTAVTNKSKKKMIKSLRQLDRF